MIEIKANFKKSLERRDRDRKISEEGRKEGREEEERDPSRCEKVVHRERHIVLAKKSLV